MTSSRGNLYTIQVLYCSSFYAVKSILVLYLIQDLSMISQEAVGLFAGIMSLSYLISLIGGVFAGEYVSFRLCLLTSLSLANLGLLVIVAAPASFVSIGLGCFVCGSGLFKPLIPLLLEEFYSKHPEERERGYTFFYALLNVGGMSGLLICGFMSIHFGYGLGFLSAIVSTLVALFLSYCFIHPRDKKYQKFPLKNYGWFYSCVLLIIGSITFFVGSIDILNMIFPYLLGCTLFSLIYIYHKVQPEERKAVLLSYLFVLSFCIFATIFEQTGGAVTLYIDAKINRILFGDFIIPTSVFQMFNPFFVIIFSFLIGKGILGVKSSQSKVPDLTHFGFKMSFGFLCSALGFIVFLGVSMVNPGEEKGNLGWIILAFLFITIGEICIVPLCLTAIAKLSPPRFKGPLIALWTCAAAYGHYLSGIIASFNSVRFFIQVLPETSSQQLNFEGIFLFTIILCLLTSLLVFAFTMIGSKLLKSSI